MSRPESRPEIWPIVVIDGVSVLSILALQALLGDGVPNYVMVLEAAGITAVGIASTYFWYKTVNRDVAAAPAAAPGDLEALRREHADNLRLLQDDLHNLGQALMKRLANKAEIKPEMEHFEALAGTVSDLAVNLAESAADLQEVKSAVFEMQAQLDQLSDALRRSGHLPEPPHPDADEPAGAGAAPAGLSRALVAGVAGGAISRLIANGAPAKRLSADFEPVASTDVEVAHPEGSPLPVSGGELGTVEQSPIVPSATDAPGFEPDFDEADFEGSSEEQAGITAFAPEPLHAMSESDLTDQEDSEVDWLTAGIPDAEAEEEAEPQQPLPATQPELLAVDDSPRRPRRPAKGDTALVAHMMIGIGNKPYLRGIGPGLSIEAGVPMDYVDVGIWQWICPEAGVPVALSVWKNDELPADGELIEIEPGEIVEIRPRFGPNN